MSFQAHTKFRSITKLKLISLPEFEQNSMQALATYPLLSLLESGISEKIFYFNIQPSDNGE